MRPFSWGLRACVCGVASVEEPGCLAGSWGSAGVRVLSEGPRPHLHQTREAPHPSLYSPGSQIRSVWEEIRPLWPGRWGLRHAAVPVPGGSSGPTWSEEAERAESLGGPGRQRSPCARLWGRVTKASSPGEGQPPSCPTCRWVSG